jgi:hypothetical protein
MQLGTGFQIYILYTTWRKGNRILEPEWSHPKYYTMMLQRFILALRKPCWKQLTKSHQVIFLSSNIAFFSQKWDDPWGSGLEQVLLIPLCVVEGDWIGWSFGWDRKNHGPVCGTIKTPLFSKALSAEHRFKFCSPSLLMVTSPCKWNILERDVKKWIIDQSIKRET